MAPKKGRGKGGGAAASPAGGAAGGAPAGLAPDLSAGFAVELHAGEKDNANLVFIEKIAAAWELIHDHHVFADIQTELPLAITGSQDDCGTQHPFDFASFKKGYCKHWHLHSRHEHVLDKLAMEPNARCAIKGDCH